MRFTSTLFFDDVSFTSIASLDGMKERTLVVDSFSKTFAMTGFRIGYAAGPAHIIGNITKLQENISACVAMPSQYAALEALQGEQDHLDFMVESYRKRRDYLADRLRSMPLVRYTPSEGTFYAFISIKETGLSSEEFAMKLLEEKQVVVVPGDAFGQYGDGYVRLSLQRRWTISKGALTLLKSFSMICKKKGRRMGINIKRLMADLYELGKIGFIPGKGTSRVAYSENFLKGRELIRSKMEEAGLITSVDAVGNLTGLLPASNDDKMAKKDRGGLAY